MFERFTDRVRRVLVLAQDEARLHSHSYIGTEHLLLGLIHENGGIAVDALGALGISLDAVREAVLKLLGGDSDDASTAPPVPAPPPSSAPLAIPPALRHRPRRIEKIRQRVSFSDVAGQEAAVAELGEIKRLLLGADLWKRTPGCVGILLYGPSGCGKTLSARALAAETHSAYVSLRSGDLVHLPAELQAARVDAAFTEARSMAPAVLLIDELHSVGPEAGLQAILDQFAVGTGVVVIGETARPDLLNPRLLRPGAFDRSIGFEKPNQQARLAILSLHAKDEVLDSGVDLAVIGERADGLGAGDLAHLMNVAALLAERVGRPAITQLELDVALRSLIAGPGDNRAA